MVEWVFCGEVNTMKKTNIISTLNNLVQSKIKKSKLFFSTQFKLVEIKV